MAKPQIKPNAKVNQIFDDLELYLTFCQDYGYVYNEATMYDMRSYVFRQFSKYMSGKYAKDQWPEAITR